MKLIEKMILEEIECINQGDLEGVCAFYTDDVIFLDISNQENVAVGTDAFRASMQEFFHGFSDLHIDVQRVFSNEEGTAAVAEYDLSGTLDGTFAEIGPTNRHFKILACSVYELRGDQFCKETLYIDANSMMSQIA